MRSRFLISVDVKPKKGARLARKLEASARKADIELVYTFRPHGSRYYRLVALAKGEENRIDELAKWLYAQTISK